MSRSLATESLLSRNGFRSGSGLVVALRVQLEVPGGGPAGGSFHNCVWCHDEGKDGGRKNRTRVKPHTGLVRLLGTQAQSAPTSPYLRRDRVHRGQCGTNGLPVRFRRQGGHASGCRPLIEKKVPWPLLALACPVRVLGSERARARTEFTNTVPVPVLHGY